MYFKTNEGSYFVSREETAAFTRSGLIVDTFLGSPGLIGMWGRLLCGDGRFGTRSGRPSNKRPGDKKGAVVVIRGEAM